MGNKNQNGPFNYLPIALLVAFAVVVGVSFSSIRNNGSANLLAMDAAGGQSNYTCDDIKVKLTTDGYTAEEKAWYEKNCMQPATPPPAPEYNCDDIKTKLATGGYTAEEKAWYEKNCTQPSTPPPAPQYNCDDLNGYKDSKGLNADEQNYYDKYCKGTTPTTTEGGCSPAAAGEKCQQPVDNFCVKFETLLKEGGTYTAEEKALYARLCVNSYPAGDVCMKLNEAIKSGNYTVAEKEQYLKLCVQPQPPEERPTQDPCGYLKDLMAKYNDQPNSEEYIGAKKKFALYCTQNQEVPNTSTNVCSDLKIKLETLIKNGETNTDDYLKTKLSFNALCTEVTPINDRCAELKLKLETYIQNGDSTSEGYASIKNEYLKSCEKPLPPARFEDDVMTNFDQKDCPFSDSKVGDLCGKAAMELYRRGVIGGFADGTFKGNDPVNRAQAAKFLLLAKYSVVNDDSGSADFSDVTPGAWYERFVLKASHLGVITGYGDGTFRPANGVNVAEFLKMMTLTFDLDTNLSYNFSDVHDSDWFAKYAGTAQKYNLFPSNTGDKLDPGHKMTRCEVAIAIYQYLKTRI